MILIGSSALKHWFPDFPRNPKDTDYLVNIKSMWDNVPGKIEYHENDILWNSDLVKGKILEPDVLYTLKISHVIGWDIFWEKHMFDIQFLNKKGCKLNKELFYKLYEYWNKIHGINKRSDLEMSANEFFNNAVKCEYEHDWLHTLLNPSPTFNKILKDDAEVEVDEEKFYALSFEDKCNLVTEEIMVMAWERWPKYDYREAYSYMLKKFILNHAPIWEAIFIIENYVALHKPKFNYFKTIENEIRSKSI